MKFAFFFGGFFFFFFCWKFAKMFYGDTSAICMCVYELVYLSICLSICMFGTFKMKTIGITRSGRYDAPIIIYMPWLSLIYRIRRIARM